MDTVDRYIHWYNERRIKESLGDEPAAVQAVAQSSGMSAFVRKTSASPKSNPFIPHFKFEFHHNLFS